jgi:exonuclease VII large subunit
LRKRRERDQLFAAQQRTAHEATAAELLVEQQKFEQKKRELKEWEGKLERNRGNVTNVRTHYLSFHCHNDCTRGYDI